MNASEQNREICEKACSHIEEIIVTALSASNPLCDIRAKAVYTEDEENRIPPCFTVNIDMVFDEEYLHSKNDDVDKINKLVKKIRVLENWLVKEVPVAHKWYFFETVSSKTPTADGSYVCSETTYTPSTDTWEQKVNVVK